MHKITIELSGRMRELLDQAIRQMPGHWNPEAANVREVWAGTLLEEYLVDLTYKHGELERLKAKQEAK